MVDGVVQRLCQKCNALHEVAAFTSGKRACTSKLAAHNARRRELYSKGRTPLRGVAAPGEHAGAPGSGGMAPSGDGGNSTSLNDFFVPEDEEMAALLGLLDVGCDPHAAEDDDAHTPSPSGASAHAVPPLPPAPFPRGVVVWVKLHAATPWEVPWGPADGTDGHGASAGLRSAAAAVLGEPVAFTGYISPGCVLLTLEALCLVSHAEPLPDADHASSAALAALLRTGGPLGAFLRREHVRGKLSVTASAGDAGAAAMTPLTPRAALCTTPVDVRRASPSGAAPPSLRCRFHGQFVQLRDAVGAGERPLAALPAVGEEGALSFDVAAAPFAAGGAAWAATSRVLLLTRDAAVVAEVAATEAALLREAPGAPCCADVDDALLALGHAMRPGCAPELAAAAVAAAMRLGWPSAAKRALATLSAAVASAHAAHADDGDDAPAQVAVATLPGGVTLLHEAAASGRPELIAEVLAAGGAAGALGTAATAAHCAGGATPLHVAAALADADAAIAVIAALTVGADAIVAWATARLAGSGATPGAVAAARGRALGALSARLTARAAAGRAAAAAARAAVECVHGVFLPVQRAELAAALLQRAAAARALAHDDATVGAACLRAELATLRAAALAEALCDGADGQPAGAASEPAPDRLPEFTLWRATRVAPRVLTACCCQGIFNALQAYEWAAHRTWHASLLPPAGRDGVVRIMTRRSGLPAFRYLFTFTLPFQAAATALAVGLLLCAAARPHLLLHLNAVLALQFLAHELVSTLVCSVVLAIVTDGATIVWPFHFASNVAIFTIIGQVCWPVPLRIAMPVLAMRAALPLATHLWRVPLWLDTPPLGVTLQVGACAVSAVLAWRQEALLRQLYAAEAERLLAAAAAVAAGAKGKPARRT
jgi:hypothetical protein